MLIQRKNGATSNILRVMLRNSSTGAGLTGLTSASSGLIISTICDNEATATAYTVAGSTIESITTLGTFAAPTATKCRFKEVDSTNHPGLYELQIADARFAVASAKVLRICLSGATNLLAKDVVVQLLAVDVDDAVRLGMTSLPNAAAEASGGLITRGTSTGQLSVSSGQVLLQAGTGAGQLDFTSGVVKANATQIAGSAVSTSSAQIGVNVVNAAGTAWASGAITSSVLATDCLTSTQLAASAVTEIWASVTDSSGVTTLLSRLSSARAGYLDNINNSNLASVPAFPSNFASLSITAGGIAKADLQTILATAVTQGASGRLAGAFSTLLDVASPVLTAASVNQTGDSYARIGSNGAGLTSIPDSAGTTTLLSRLTSTRAGYLDNLSVAPPTAATIAAAVWDLTTTGHTTGGTFGAAMNAAGSAGDPWATALPGAYAAGSAGYILGNRLDATISSRATNAGVWTNGTRNLTALGFTYASSDFGTDWLTSTGLAASAVSEIWASVADSAGVTTLLSRLSNTRATNLDNLDATISSRSTYAGGDTSGVTTLLTRLSATRAGYLDNLSGGAPATSADVLTQVNAALNTALTLPGQAAPVTSPTIRTALAQLFQQSVRPYTQDSASQKLYDATATTVLQKRSVSDNGTTLTYGALVSGP